MNRTEFARLLGCSRKAVFYAERLGIFSDGLEYVDGQPVFHVQTAAREWAVNISPTMNNETLVRRLFEVAGIELNTSLNTDFDMEEIERLIESIDMEEIDRIINEGNEEIERILNEPIEVPDCSKEELDMPMDDNEPED